MCQVATIRATTSHSHFYKASSMWCLPCAVLQRSTWTSDLGQTLPAWRSGSFDSLFWCSAFCENMFVYITVVRFFCVCVYSGDAELHLTFVLISVITLPEACSGSVQVCTGLCKFVAVNRCENWAAEKPAVKWRAALWGNEFEKGHNLLCSSYWWVHLSLDTLDFSFLSASCFRTENSLLKKLVFPPSYITMHINSVFIT